MMGSRKEKDGKKSQGRTSEKRRERSKVAARCRRSMESEIFSDLGQCLPVPESIKNTLDKASIMRLCLCNLKLRDLMNTLFKTKSHTEICSGTEFESAINNAIGGFVIVFCTDGDIIYVSENITSHLGLLQCDVMGQSIYEFSHPCDHADIRELLVVNKTEDVSSYRSGFIRFKCTLTSRGRSVHLRSASYRVINCTGRLFVGIANRESFNCYIGICEPLPHPSDIDIPLNKQTFLSRHNPDMTCEYVDESIEKFLHFKPNDLIGKSIFKFHHAADNQIVASSYKSLYVKGQTQTERYRFLAKYGGWIWVVTQATVLNAANSLKPNAVVCLHFVTSEIENELEIVSDIQTATSSQSSHVNKPEKTKSKAKVKKRNTPTEKENLSETTRYATTYVSCPSPSTEKIFAPRTDDMDSGFLMLCDNSTPTFNKDSEPEDLTHLAPIPGDDCVSLNVPLLDDLLKSFDQSKLEYSVNGYTIDVDANSDRLQSALTPSSCSASSGTSGFYETDEPYKDIHESPLLLDSDPLMSLPSKDEKELTLAKHDISSIRTLSKGSTLFDQIQRTHNNLPQNGALTSIECPTSNWLTEELSDISKSCIPGNARNYSLSIIDSVPTELLWNDTVYPSSSRTVNLVEHQQGPLTNASLEYARDSKKKYTQPLGLEGLDHKRKVLQPCIDIERGDNTKIKMDILSILNERRRGDFPKVVTSIIFGDQEPPIKLKRQEIISSNLKSEYFTDISRTLTLSENNQCKSYVTNTSDASNIRRTNIHEIPDNNLRNMTNQPCQLLAPQRFVYKRGTSGRLFLEPSPMTTLSELTRQDYEVNAPLDDFNLLQGYDLLTALDTECFSDSLLP